MSPEPSGRLISRRTALQRGAMVGGAMLWAAPTVQVMSASANAADLASQPPTPGGGPETPGPVPGGPAPGGTEVEGASTGAAALGDTDFEDSNIGPPGRGETEVEATGTGTTAASLPRTGVAFPPMTTAVVAAGLVAGGAAMHRLARESDDEAAAK